MTYVEVLTVVLLASFNINIVQGSLCSGSLVIVDGETFDVFCLGVKYGKIYFPEGAGCLNDMNCDYTVIAKSATKGSEVQWILNTNVEVSNILLVLSHANTTTMSMKNEVYKLPANVVALEGKTTKGKPLYRARLTNSDGKEGTSSDECFKFHVVKGVRDGFSSARQLDCKSNGFKANLYKDELYATVVVMDTANPLGQEYHHESPVKLLGRGETAGWKKALYFTLAILVVLLWFACIGGCIYCCIRSRKKTEATVTPVVAGQQSSTATENI